MSEITKISLDSTEYDIHDAKPHGTLTAPLNVTGGDGSSAGKIAMDHAHSGQITDENTSTLFGFLSNNATDLTVGGTGYGMKLRGSGDRPQYGKGSATPADVAMYSDLPTNPLTLSSKSGYNCNTLYDGKVWLVGSEFASVESPYRKFANVDEVKAAIAAEQPQGYYILIKGSNSNRLFQLPELL